MLCNLCSSKTRPFEVFQDREFVQCVDCKAVLLSPEHYLSRDEEKARYELHNNNVKDPRYIKFVKPVIQQVKKDFTSESIGLDFGCGTGPVITSQLNKFGYSLELYDPYFEPDISVFEKKYDFIVCCEVMEHFQMPPKEFGLMSSLLKEESKLYCKTELLEETIDFKSWHYKNDPTHVIFYKPETLEWLRKKLNFKVLEIKRDLLIFTK